MVGLAAVGRVPAARILSWENVSPDAGDRVNV